ncbi:hypothetical protein VNO77_34493 [Canavalia gladiata]|uniref:Uncharacterized protein n=1 Tax=Canavalia gladiata TaxID=3824 RepID=A0AAN9KG95_CANGL
MKRSFFGSLKTSPLKLLHYLEIACSFHLGFSSFPLWICEHSIMSEAPIGLMSLILDRDSVLNRKKRAARRELVQYRDLIVFRFVSQRIPDHIGPDADLCLLLFHHDSANMSISRDSMHKRSAPGGKKRGRQQKAQGEGFLSGVEWRKRSTSPSAWERLARKFKSASSRYYAIENIMLKLGGSMPIDTRLESEVITPGVAMFSAWRVHKKCSGTVPSCKAINGENPQPRDRSTSLSVQLLESTGPTTIRIEEGRQMQERPQPECILEDLADLIQALGSVPKMVLY